MDRSLLFDLLARHGDMFRAMLTGLSPAEIRWKPAPEKWCTLEVICHLHDEEREDFRARLLHVLDMPHEPMPQIDPAGWVSQRRYQEQDFHIVLVKFLEERQRSLIWLRSLADAPWENFYLHPKVGPVSCELLLTNWVAHDLHHLRQLINLRYGYLQASTTVPLDYAGIW